MSTKYRVPGYCIHTAPADDPGSWAVVSREDAVTPPAWRPVLF
jgi:hypothetical protein